MGRSRDSKAQARTFAGIAALLGALLVFFFASDIGSYGRGLLASVFAPHPEAEYAGLSRDALVSRLSDTEAELTRVRYQALLYGALAQENASLREQVRAAAVSSGVTARVIARPPQTSYDTLIVDQGSEAGVQEHDAAVYQGIILGRVVRVDAKTAVVNLFSSSGAARDVVLGEPRAVAVATGLGGGAFELSLPQGIAVAAGDIVRFPSTASLVLGVVQSISADAREASQTVRFAIPVSFADLDFIQLAPLP